MHFLPSFIDFLDIQSLKAYDSGVLLNSRVLNVVCLVLVIEAHCFGNWLNFHHQVKM